MLDILKNILLSQEWVEDKNITNVQQINDSTYEFTISHEHIFIVCDEEGAEEYLNMFREATIEAAKLDIPDIYHDFFEFDEFAENAWQTLYDAFDTILEVNQDNKKYYICYL